MRVAGKRQKIKIKIIYLLKIGNNKALIANIVTAVQNINIQPILKPI
jgi:hypothetical protein